MKTLIGKKILRADPTTFTGLLDQEVFDINLKSINKEYEAYVLNKGDFDERIFLGKFKNQGPYFDEILHFSYVLI